MSIIKVERGKAGRTRRGLFLACAVGVATLALVTDSGLDRLGSGIARADCPDQYCPQFYLGKLAGLYWYAAWMCGPGTTSDPLDGEIMTSTAQIPDNELGCNYVNCNHCVSSALAGGGGSQSPGKTTPNSFKRYHVAKAAFTGKVTATTGLLRKAKQGDKFEKTEWGPVRVLRNQIASYKDKTGDHWFRVILVEGPLATMGLGEEIEQPTMPESTVKMTPEAGQGGPYYRKLKDPVAHEGEPVYYHVLLSSK